MLGLVDMPVLVSCGSRKGVAKRGVEWSLVGATTRSTPRSAEQLLSRLDGVVGPQEEACARRVQNFCTKPQQALEYPAT